MPFKTIDRHLYEKEKEFPGASGELTNLMFDIALAGKIISRETNKAGLVNILGQTSETNVHGEIVKKLDIFAHETLTRVIAKGRSEIYMLASEELEKPISMGDSHPQGKYIINFDPLDGSSNIEANVSVGTIFSILKRDENMSDEDACIQKGSRQVASGYIIYGSSTMFVYTTGQGVHGFTLDSSLGEFILSHENIRIPIQGKIYSINEGNFRRWQPGIQAYIKYIKEMDDETNRPYSLRYIGSLVADFHRNLLYGGIFLYPGDTKNPDGRLRLMYEANPVAFIAEQAGGAASTGKERILDLEPQSLHQRVPLIVGSAGDVSKACEIINQSA